MERTCPCCSKSFVYRIPTRYEFLFSQRLEQPIMNYMLDNFDSPLCINCIDIIRETFNQVSVNPSIIKEHIIE